MKQLSCAAVFIALALCAGTALAVTPEQKCQEKKLKARGKLELCLQKNAAGLIAGKPDGSAACRTKFQTALTKAGTACRYLDNGNGTVSDLNTGLLWEKKDTNCPGPDCVSDAFDWSPSTDNPDGTAFTAFLYGLDGGTSTNGTRTRGCFTGHCDWRLPTIEELAGIVDATQGQCGGGSGACIDPAFGPTEVGRYWSATTADNDPGSAWVVYFGATVPEAFFKLNNAGVRAVRGGL